LVKKEDKVSIRQFKDGRHSWWLGNLHFQLLDGELILAAGGIASDEDIDRMKKYLKLKKLL
jgi:hypothetical protein